MSPDARSAGFLPDWLPSIGPVEHLGYVGAGLLVYLVLTRVRQQRRTPSAATAWVLFIALMPYVAVPVFLAFGTRKVVRPTARLRAAGGAADAASPVAGASPADAGPAVGAERRRSEPEWAGRLLRGLGVADAVPSRRVQFDADGAQAWSSFIQLCRSAQRTLDVSTYVLGADAIGEGVAAEVAFAIRRGVRVRVLVDAIGSLRTHRPAIKLLKQEGAVVRRFMPMGRSPIPGRTNLRIHRKVAIADGRRLWSGGRNLADEYFEGSDAGPAWFDLSFSVDGPVALTVQQMFDSDWRRAGGWLRRHRPRLRLRRATADAGAAGDDDIDTIAAHTAHRVQWVLGGPDCADDNLHALLLSLLFAAQRRVLLVSPYFIPDDALTEAMCLAALRGVHVQLLLPAQSNHRIADLARERALRRVALAGVQVLLHPTMVHAKAAVVDDTLALCGSANLDGRSLFLNYEAMMVFYDRRDVDWLSGWMQARIAVSIPFVPRKPAFVRDIVEGLVLAVAYQL